MESLEGLNVRRATAATGVRSHAVRIPWGEQGSEAGLRGWRLAATPAGLTRRRARASREAPIPGEEQGPEGGTSGAFRVAARRLGRRGGEQAVEGVEGVRESVHLHKRRGRKVAGLDASRGCGGAAAMSRSLQPIPDPLRWKRCRGPKSRRGELRADASRRTFRGADPPAALKGRARRESSPGLCGNAGETGAVLREAEFEATVSISWCARKNRNAAETACRVC